MPRTNTRTRTNGKRAAAAKRLATLDTRDALTSIERTVLADPQRVPVNRRFKTANALAIIAGAGHLFAVACAKAYVRRTWKQWDDRSRVWQFVDDENAAFAREMDAEMVASWNAPDYE